MHPSESTSRQPPSSPLLNRPFTFLGLPYEEVFIPFGLAWGFKGAKIEGPMRLLIPIISSSAIAVVYILRRWPIVRLLTKPATTLSDCPEEDDKAQTSESNGTAMPHVPYVTWKCPFASYHASNPRCDPRTVPRRCRKFVFSSLLPPSSDA